MTPNKYAEYLAKNNSFVTLKNSSIQMKVVGVVENNDSANILQNDAFVKVTWRNNSGKEFSDTISVNLIKEV